MIRYAPGTDTVEWTMNGEDPSYPGSGDAYSARTWVHLDFSALAGTVPATFGRPSAVYSPDGYTQMFDNANARGLRFTVGTFGLVTTATFSDAWAMSEPSSSSTAPTCTHDGSAITVPGSSDADVVAMCTDEKLIEELSDSSGVLVSTPPVIIDLDPLDTCGGMHDTPMIFGWARAFPVNHIGDF